MAIPFYRLGFINLILAIPLIFAKYVVDGIHSDNILLLPIGVTPKHFYTFDYFPIFPWFGIFLLGLIVGKIIPKNESCSKSLVRFVCYLGKNSLKIYLIHQPLIVTFMIIIFGDRTDVLTFI